MFPHQLGQGLAGTAPDELAAFLELTPSGIGSHWESRDSDRDTQQDRSAELEILAIVGLTQETQPRG
jgi:hypothetical protein